MEKLSSILMLYMTLICMLQMFANGKIDESPEGVETWFKKLSHAKEKLTKVHFYFHDAVSGKNPTSVWVARANSTFTSPTAFGLVTVIDNLLTVGPEPTSKILGRAKGMYTAASQEETGLLMTLNLVFKVTKYNGSTLSVLGHNPVFHKHREMPILGGSGVFRLARGIATARTYSFNFTTGDAVVEYNAVVLHY